MSERRLSQSRPERAALLLLAALALDAPAAGRRQEADDPGPPSAAASAIDAGVLAAVALILSPAADAGVPDPEAMAEALSALGAPAVPALVCLLAGEIEAPGVVPGAEQRPVHPLALEQRAPVLREALARIPPASVLEHFSARLGQSPDSAMRLLIADLLGRIDDPGACDLLVELVESFDPLELRARYVQETVVSALAAQLLLRPDALDDVWQSGFDVPAERLVVFARAVGATHTSHGIDLLASWIDIHPDADGELLDQIGRVAGQGGLAVTPAALGAVRSKIFAEEPEVRRSAIVAAGKLCDESVFEDLVHLLEGGQAELVVAGARWSLQTISGVDLGTDPEAWLAWRERELVWLDQQGPALLAALGSEVPGVVLAAVSEALRHPFHRHVVAEALGPLTAHPDPFVARGVCVAIAQLESTRSVPWLLAALRQPDPELQEHAAAALRRLTGLDLPPEHEAWSQALSG